MNSNVKVIVLIVVIALCLGFVVMRLVGGKGGGGGGAVSADTELQMICLECKQPYTAKVSQDMAMPLQMAGTKAEPKHQCPNCGKSAGVAAVKCAACGALVPSPGMQAMNMMGPGMKPPLCPACKKPLKPAPTAESGMPAP
ncbi:MAG: hypothetical protein JXR77_10290 [Lentisphaeria bacterium]|nr:hypothetical protein [Lentisphaeria bacterium]